MNDTKKELNQRFWFLVVFSLLLIFVFAVYLPDRFYWQTASEIHEEAGEMMDEHPEADAMHEEDVHGGYEFHEEKDILEGLSVNLTATPTPIRIGEPAQFDFFVNKKPRGEPIVSSELEIEHERLMHVIGVRDDMNEFFHIHPYPTSTPGVFTIRGIFSKPGRYKVWSEVKKDGVIHATGHSEFEIEGVGPRQEKTISFDRHVVAGDYEVDLIMEEPVEKGHEHESSFDIHTASGEEVEVENYLGAPIHLTIIRDDWKEFLHTHPIGEGEENHQGGSGATPVGVLKPVIFAREISNGASPEEDDAHMSLELISVARAHGESESEGTMPQATDETINFHVVFPEAGLYKAFAQFRPRGIDLPPDDALTAEFWIRVREEAAPKTGLSSWWILLISSGIAIVILSFAVKRFITVKPVSVK